MDHLAEERVRLARERWQTAQSNLFAVLPPNPHAIGVRDPAPATLPSREKVSTLLKHAQGSYADYLNELHRLHGG